MNLIGKRLFSGVAISCLLAVAAPTAHATLLLSGTVNGSNFCASDQNAGCGFGTPIADGNPAVNQLGLGSASASIIIAGVQVFGSLHTATYGPLSNMLNSSSLQIINNTGVAADILVTVSATNFVPPSFRAFTSGSGTFQDLGGATIDLRWWDDPSNQQGAETPADTPGNLIDSFSFASTFAPESFAHNGGPFGVADLLPYSMTLQFHITLPAGAELVSRGQTINKDIGQVSEPAPLLLLGAGLVLLFGRFRKPPA